MAYVYRHIRLDKNVPFYIGIGSDDDYARANTKTGRNNYWNNIVSKTNYEVEIIFDNIEWGYACEKEIEFISIYGRKKDGGTLANLTLGGEGQLGMIPWNFGKETPEEIRAKQSAKRMGVSSPIKGTKRPQHVIDAVRKACTGRKPWNKGKKHPQELIDKFLVTMKGRFLKGENHPMYGTKMPEATKLLFAKLTKERGPWNKGMKGQYKMPNQTKKRIPVLKLSLSGEFICEYESATMAAKENNTRKSGISAAATGRIKSHHGYMWKYKPSTIIG